MGTPGFRAASDIGSRAHRVVRTSAPDPGSSHRAGVSSHGDGIVTARGWSAGPGRVASGNPVLDLPTPILLMSSRLAAPLAALLVALPAGAQSPPPPPRLVVMITVDQLLPEYFTRWPGQLTGGLHRL